MYVRPVLCQLGEDPVMAHPQVVRASRKQLTNGSFNAYIFYCIDAHELRVSDILGDGRELSEQDVCGLMVQKSLDSSEKLIRRVKRHNRQVDGFMKIMDLL
jgi:hypothetical protein